MKTQAEGAGPLENTGVVQPAARAANENVPVRDATVSARRPKAAEWQGAGPCHFLDEAWVSELDTDRPRLGMSVRDLTPDLAQRVGVPQDTRGVLITDVETGEPAEEAGLVPGDVIVSVNGETVESVNDFEKAIGGFEGGDRIRLRVRSAQGYRIVVLRLK